MEKILPPLPSSRTGGMLPHMSADAPAPAPDPALLALREAMRRFAAERDWDQFHSPKNLAAALSVEAAELLEHFQWLTEEASRTLTAEARARVAEEMADVLLYLVRLADKLDVDLAAAAIAKIARNAQKYPVEKSRGSSRKYTEL
jgi:NTP pyrophosphatase (non-canonical NTP hydrolase)